MDKNTPATFRKITVEDSDKTDSDVKEAALHFEYTSLIRYDAKGPEAENKNRVIALFSAFTANIIKEETLFTR